MKKHIKIYLDHFGYGTTEFIKDELTGYRAQDIHHIKARGMGGSKSADHIDNLMALTREAHLIYGDKKQFIQFLKDAHFNFIETGVPFLFAEPGREEWEPLIKQNELIKGKLNFLKKYR